MKNIKHSKYKNTGILFELLVRQITSDTLKGIDSPSINILKKYFVKSELGKEYKLYETIIKSKTDNEFKANTIINTIIENCKKLNKTSLKRQKYNIIKEIKTYYDIDTFFSTKISNYKELASIYTLIENYTTDVFDSEQVISNKMTLFEYLITPIQNKPSSANIINEFQSFDKDLRILTYKIMLDKFNTKYDHLSNEQKLILKEFIECNDSTNELRNFYNNKINELKNQFKLYNNSIEDISTRIKFEEVSKLLIELNKNEKINNDNLINLLHYYELLEELKKI
jgi:hypothetical protein